MNDVHFDVKRPTVLYVHGWLESIYSESVQHIVSAYLDRGDWNIIALNWHQLAGSPLYPEAFRNVKMVSKRHYSSINDLIQFNLS